MTDQELNSYRLTSLDEPTDEMLSAIMREAAADAKLKGEAADQAFWANLKNEAERARVEHIII